MRETNDYNFFSIWLKKDRRFSSNILLTSMKEILLLFFPNMFCLFCLLSVRVLLLLKLRTRVLRFYWNWYNQWVSVFTILWVHSKLTKIMNYFHLYLKFKTTIKSTLGSFQRLYFNFNLNVVCFAWYLFQFISDS